MLLYRPQDMVEVIMLNLSQEVDGLINQGVYNFISGGALGFDQIAAALIIAKKRPGFPFG